MEGSSTKIAVISDAHLLYQAEWIEDENALRDEAKEVLDNFDRASKKITDESPSAVVLAGDMFDTKVESGQRVAHREAEKYMVQVRQILNGIAEKTGCKIYALRGNHDSEPVLRSLENVLAGKFIYAKNRAVKIGQTSFALMDTHYLTGSYDIPLSNVPNKADILFMHESVPLPRVSAPPKETFASICKSHNLVFNGHMHFYSEKALGIPNFCLLPAFIPSREIKNNWMVKYSYENGEIETKKQESPFGYVTIEERHFSFKRYDPLQVIVRVEVMGKNAADFNQGIKQVFDLLMDRSDRQKLRVWISTNADKITVERLFWDIVAGYPEIKTLDIFSERVGSPAEPVPTFEKEFGNVAFTRDELIERAMRSLDKRQQKVAIELFETVFSPEVLAKRPDTRQAFRDLLEIMSKDEKVSETFVERAWELSKER